MPKVAIAAGASANLSFVNEIRKITGDSIADVKRHIESSDPFIEMDLFKGDFLENAQKLEKIIQLAAEQNVVLKIWEFPAKSAYASLSDKQQSEITEEILRNILDGARQDYERMLDAP